MVTSFSARYKLCPFFVQGLLTTSEVRQRIRDKKIRDPIKWLPRHYPVPWKPQPRGYPIFQVSKNKNLINSLNFCNKKKTVIINNPA